MAEAPGYLKHGLLINVEAENAGLCAVMPVKRLNLAGTRVLFYIKQLAWPDSGLQTAIFFASSSFGFLERKDGQE